MKRILTRGGALAAGMWAALALAPAAWAADALNGKTLYLNGPVSGGTACAACHGASPAGNVSGILKAANAPSVISGAFAANRGGMGSIYKGKFSAAEIGDLAAFIGNPDVTAAPAATLAPATLSFSGTAIGQSSAALSTTLTNSGNAALNIATIAVGGANASDFAVTGGSCGAGGVVAAGANCTVQLVFRPGAAGARSAALTIGHNGAGGGSSVTLAGTGNAAAAATISVSANALAFSALATGSTSPVQAVTVSNPGQVPLSFTGITLSGANAGIFTLGGTCAVSAPVAPNGSCTVTVTAAPVAAGAFTASVNLASNAANGNVAIGLSGSASAPAPSLAANPSAIAFGVQPVGAAAATRDVTITIRGNVPVTFNSIAVSGAAGVTIGSGSSGGGDCRGTLAVAASCNVPLAFAPTAEGNVAATLLVRSTAPDVAVGITGAGTTAAVARPALSDTGAIAFADTQVGQVSAAHRTTLSNSGNAALKIVSIVLNGGSQGDFALAGTCAAGATVSPGGNCAIDATFSPTAAGARSADLLVQTDGGAQLAVHLGGNALEVPTPAPNLSSSPQSFDFGATAVGGAAPVKRITLTNRGGTVLVLAGATFTGPFALATGEANACGAFPLTLAAGASCELPVRFTPSATGGAGGNVVLQAAGGSWTIPLSGQGGAPAPAGVDQAGQASNQGGGGCSAVQHGDDPMLAVLAVLAGTVLLWRRRQPAGRADRKDLINASGDGK